MPTCCCLLMKQQRTGTRLVAQVADHSGNNIAMGNGTLYVVFATPFFLPSHLMVLSHMISLKVLQFISYRMVSSYFAFHIVLIFSLAYVPMIGFIAWYFWVRSTCPLLNSNPTPFPFYYYQTGEYLITHLWLCLLMDSFAFRPILSYRTRIPFYSSRSFLFYGIPHLRVP